MEQELAARHAASQRVGRHVVRSRTGCLTCRRRHYKCDEALPNCSRCRQGQLDCVWERCFTSKQRMRANAENKPKSHSALFQSLEMQQKRSSPVDERGYCSLQRHIMMSEFEYLSFYLSCFYDYSLQICCYTDLIDLPKRSIIPTIINKSVKSGGRGMTNWANFFLPHLALGVPEDPLSSAIAAYTALWMQDYLRAVSFYYRVLRSLRRALKQKDAGEIDNQEYLRIWASVVLLGMYDLFTENHVGAAKHHGGAITLCLLAKDRFPMTLEQESPIEIKPTTAMGKSYISVSSASPSSESRATSLLISEESSKQIVLNNAMIQDRPRNETELPYYLTRLTKLYSAANLALLTPDFVWPQFARNPGYSVFDDLLERAAKCYALTVPLVQDVYIAKEGRSFGSKEEYVSFLGPFIPRYLSARRCINEYRAILDNLSGTEYEVQSSTADCDFPFSPILRYANPQMVNAAVMPSIFLVLLAPFLSSAEHAEALRHTSGILAGRASTPGLCIAGANPDLFIAAHWKRGPERDFFREEVRGRRGDFMLSLRRIWAQIDGIIDSGGRTPDHIEILGIALEEWRAAMLTGFKLTHITYWPTQGYGQEPWAVAVGALDPRDSAFASQAEKDRRRDWPDVRYFHHRAQEFRQRNGWDLPNLKSQGKSETTARITPVTQEVFEVENPDDTEEAHKGVHKLDKYDETTSHALHLTTHGRAASAMWRTDADIRRMYFLV